MMIRATEKQGPSLSILLPTFNDGKLFERQLKAILRQLTPADELVVLNDGCTDDTALTIADIDHPRTIRLHNRRPSGVCQAYNQCGRVANGEWFLGASGNDWLCDGALNAFRRAARRCPDSRVAFGNVGKQADLQWLPASGFIPADHLPAIWYKQGGWRTHGAGAFIRRDVWRNGYPVQCEWMADFVQTFLLALEFGCLYVHANISRITQSESSFCANHGRDERYNRAIVAVRKHCARPEYDGIRKAMREFHDFTGWWNERPVNENGRPHGKTGTAAKT